MAVYSYRARSAEGKAEQGTVTASDITTAARILRDKSLLVISLREQTGLRSFINKQSPLLAVPKINQGELALFFEEFATLTAVGIPAHEALAKLAREVSNSRANIIQRLLQDVMAGSTIAAAMAKQPQNFPPHIIGLVEAGETGGVLEDILRTLSRSLKDEFRAREKLKSALAYPLILLVTVILSVIAMTIFVLPVFGTLLQDLGAELPLPTKVLLSTADFLADNLWAMPLMIIFIAGIYFMVVHNEMCRLKIDEIILLLPIIGALVIYGEWQIVLNTLSLLIKSGIRLDRAIELAASITRNRAVSKRLNEVREAILRGSSFAETLDTRKILPPTLAQMLLTGEQAGELEVMLQKAADFAKVIADNRSARLEALAEPVVIFILGGIIFFFVLSLMLPLLEAMDSLM